MSWKSWFQTEQVKRMIRKNLPEMKKHYGIFYRLHTLFLPDRYVPEYYLWNARLISLLLLYGGVKMILYLISVI